VYRETLGHSHHALKKIKKRYFKLKSWKFLLQIDYFSLSEFECKCEVHGGAPRQGNPIIKKNVVQG